LLNILLKIKIWIFNNTIFLQKIGEMQFYFAKDPEKPKSWEDFFLDPDNSWILWVAVIGYYSYPSIKKVWIDWWYAQEEISTNQQDIQNVIVFEEFTSPKNNSFVEDSIHKNVSYFLEHLYV